MMLVLVSLCISNASSVPIEETTDTVVVDVYDPMDSDKTEKDYADFKSSYEKIYQMSSGPQFLSPPSMQQSKPWQPIEESVADEIQETTISDDGDIYTTTMPPQTEQPITIRSSTFKSTQRPITFPTSFPSYERSPLNAELRLSKPALVLDPESMDNKSQDDLVNKMVIAAQQSQVVFVRNDSNIHNESTDYVNDGLIETNHSQPITSIPYSLDTTITSLPSSRVYIPTQTPNSLSHLFSTSTSITPITQPPSVPLENTQTIQPTQSNGKKSKQIEELPRIYKYSADEIVRKYLDDTFLRAPLATLIDTAPEPLRKAKLLWKSALRPNTPIDIVLVAFNSSGKNYNCFVLFRFYVKCACAFTTETTRTNDKCKLNFVCENQIFECLLE